MINIICMDGETVISAKGELVECVNEALNVMCGLPLSITKRVDGTEEEKREVAIDILMVSAGAMIHKLYGGDLDYHIEAMKRCISSHINPEAGEAEAEEPAPEETAEGGCDNEQSV